MRIGFDAKRAFYNQTGLGNYSRDSIRILSHYYKDNDYFLYTPKLLQNNRLSFIYERENCHTRVPFSLIGNLFTKYWRSKNIVKDLIQDEIDIYHGLSHELPLGIEKTKIKSVVSIHDVIFIRYPHLFTIIDRKIYHKKILSACKRADKIIAISKQTKSDIIKFFNIPENKVEVVYQGCNVIFQKSISKDEKQEVISKYNLPQNFLLYVSSITERKNLLNILKSIHKLNNQHLVIIGDGKAYKNKCLEYIHKHKLKEKVHLIHKIDLKEMAAIYQSADIMLYPSLFEGFGLPILEALFSKTPVITSKGGCFSEAGGKHSIYINPQSEQELTKAIIKIQADKNLRAKMIEEGYKYAQNFTDIKVAKNLFNIYKNL
ncbi:MAG: hypothetical protein CMD02_02475 [Flavobacteriales bacterium]|nr:hypothetical protein [Flavobacteriales bacterium]